MAIAAALNILISSPSAQLTSDLKKQGLTVTQFANHIKATYGAAATKAVDDINKMTASLGQAFNKQIVSVKELATGTALLARAYDYVQAGGESFAAMMRDAEAIEKKHSDGTAVLLNRLKQLDAMYAANKLSAAAYRAELQAMTGAQAKLAASTSLGAGIKALAGRTTPQQDFAQAKRIADRAFSVGAIGNAQHAAEMVRLNKQLADTTGVTAARAAVLADQEQRRNNVIASHNRLADDANNLNATHASALEKLRQRQLYLNAAKGTGILTEHAHTAAMREATTAYRAQTSTLARMGFTMQGLKGAAAFLNPWFIAIAAVGKGVHTFGEFQSAMDKVGTLAGTTAGEMSTLTAAASELGRTTVFSAKDAAVGMSALAQAGFKTEQILQAMRPTMALAAIGQMEVGEAAEVAARIMAGMQIPASQFADAVDSIALAASSSVTTVAELGEAMKFVGPAAHQAGMQIDEVMASLSVLANAGMSGELGGTALRNLFLRMAKPTNEAQAALDEMGVSLVDVHGDMLPMVSIVRQFEEAMQDMGSMEKLRALNSVFRNRGAVAMSAMTGAGADTMQQMLDLQSQRAGVAADMEAELNDNLFGDFEMLTSALSGLATDATLLGGTLRLLTNLLTITVKTIQFTFQVLKLAVQTVVTGLLKSAAYIISWLDKSEGDRLHRVADEWGGQGMLDTGSAMKATLGEMWEATKRGIGGGVESLVGGSDSELARLKTIQEIQNEAAARGQQLSIDEAKRIQGQQKLLQSVDERVSKLRDEAQQLMLGADAYELQQLRAQGALQTDIARVAEAQKLRDLNKQNADLVAQLIESRKALETSGMTAGQKALHELGANALPSHVRAAHALDENNARADIGKTTRDAMGQASGFRAELGAGRTLDRYDEMLRQARLTAVMDGQVSAAEKADLARLQALLEQNRALEKQVGLARENRQELVKNAEDMKKTAEELALKHNPIKAYQQEFVKLKTMLAAGLIDQATFDESRSDLQDDTLKSAGPANLGYSKAIERGSAEDYSATLKQQKNPEYEELRKLALSAEKSQRTFNEIRDGVKALKEGEALSIAP